MVFSVLGKEVADTLSSLSKRITKPDGFKIVLIVKPSTPPVVTLDSSIEATIKDVMAKRYNANSKFLDLSNFRKDPDFISRELYISLERPNILSVVSRMIQENVPDLAVLNLGDNRLKFLDKLSPISSICQNLKAVNLSKNMVSFYGVIGYPRFLTRSSLDHEFGRAGSHKSTSTHRVVPRRESLLRVQRQIIFHQVTCFNVCNYLFLIAIVGFST